MALEVYEVSSADRLSLNNSIHTYSQSPNLPLSDIDPTNHQFSQYPRVSMARAKCSLGSTHGGRSSRAWHTSAIQFQAISTSICLVMITCFTVSSSRGGPVGTTELFSGECSHAVNINRVLQAVLALLAIGISVSSDFFMRLASSPTVDDLRQAHSQGRSLDIAVHSLQNVRYISHWRRLGWTTLVLLAVPIQLFSHSIAFISFSSTGYSRLLVSEAFTTGQPFAYPGVALLGSNLTKMARSQFNEILPNFESASTEWDRLEVGECRHIYYQDLDGLQSHRNLLVVTETSPDTGAKGWIAAQVWMDCPGHYDDSFSEYNSELENSLWSFAIYCDVDRDGYYNNHETTLCSLSYKSHVSHMYGPETWAEGDFRDTSSYWLSGPIDGADMKVPFQTPRVKYCLSEPYSAPCKVYVSNFFLLVTMLCTLFGCTCSTLIARFCWHKETCQSIGDALQVFLEDGESFVQMPGALPAGCNSGGTAPSPARWTPMSKWEAARPRWGQAVSKSMWLGAYVPIGMLLLAGSAALGAMGKNLSQVPNPLLRKQQKLRLTGLKIR